MQPILARLRQVILEIENEVQPAVAKVAPKGAGSVDNVLKDSTHDI
jgi:hypothetical protein